MRCHTEMPCRRHRTWHPTPSQYTDTGPTCCCAIYWCGTSHWNTQLPILMSWVRPNRETLPRSSTHTHQRKLNLMLSWWSSRKYRTNRVLNPGPVVCESITLSARPQRLPVHTCNSDTNYLLSSCYTGMSYCKHRIWQPDQHIIMTQGWSVLVLPIYIT